MYTIYIGLKDKTTYQQSVATEASTNLIKNTCSGYQVSYSTNLQEGGYTHEISAALRLIKESVLIEERTYFIVV